ncbi:HlyD family secretion protein [Tepidicaulis sp.]|uniref:HlyD family secretion protein n=1 Tax=Tepidicaulis sp. TaxID=1920809 RepID=UPI003B5909C4
MSRLTNGLNKWLIAALVIAALAVAGGIYWWLESRNTVPEGIAWGNGRIEADETDIATKYAGRVSEIFVDEGDMVEAGQLLARMDTEELQAQIRQAEAEIRRLKQVRSEAEAQIARLESELSLAEKELERALILFGKGHVSQERVDQRRTARDAAKAALDQGKAGLGNAQEAVLSAMANLDRLNAQLKETALTAPTPGRVLYRLAEPGEVLAGGGKVLTLLDVTDVYMTIFLPTTEAGRVAIGGEARIILDAAPDYVVPAHVSFVSAQAQFTPKEVETRSEREKLMFRVKVRIPRELLNQYMTQVKTGLPGVAYVKLDGTMAWPDDLAVRLPE